MFTLETTLIFPTIFIVTIAMILFSLVIYQKVVIFQRAHIIAERVAFTWDNSEKDFETGAFEIYEYPSMDDQDGLYWRTNYIGETFIKKVFGDDIGDSGVTDDKIEHANTGGQAMFPSGNVTIEAPASVAINPQVKVTVTGNLKVPDIVGLISSGDFEATAYASVKDPVELIRMTDFIIQYGMEIKDSISN
ncbi:hypothetical protein [Paraliobacillus sediminis]|uniref:hypothetical protein n=1 Tax=Paraliobacillus sediminis TaxID=1885916 RepID=UPI000E3C5E3A|nr:hypothetical protein [Paraliobacillus sediminis]